MSEAQQCFYWVWPILILAGLGVVYKRRAPFGDLVFLLGWVDSGVGIESVCWGRGFVDNWFGLVYVFTVSVVENNDNSVERRRRRRLDREAAAWLMLSKVMGVMVILVLLVATYFWFIPEVQEKERLGKVLQSKLAELDRERLVGRQRERERQLLQSDPEYIETIARDRLDLMKDGEMIFRMDFTDNEAVDARMSAGVGE